LVASKAQQINKERYSVHSKRSSRGSSSVSKLSFDGLWLCYAVVW